MRMGTQVQVAPETNVDANTRALAHLRIAVGVLFLIFGEYKVFGTQFTLGGGFEGWINRLDCVSKNAVSGWSAVKVGLGCTPEPALPPVLSFFAILVPELPKRITK